jgi:hypothetical protein
MSGEYFDASFSTNGSSGSCRPCGNSSIDFRSLVPAFRHCIRGTVGNSTKL